MKPAVWLISALMLFPAITQTAAQARVVTYATHPSFDLPGLTSIQEDEELSVYFEGIAERHCGIDLVRVPWGKQVVEIYSAVLSRPDGLVDLGRNDPSTFSIWLHNGTRDGGRKDFYVVDKHGKSARGMAGRAALHEFGHLLPEFRAGTQDGNGHINNNACIMDIDLAAKSMCPQEIAVFRKHYGLPKTPQPGTFLLTAGRFSFGDGTKQALVGRFNGKDWGPCLYDPKSSTFVGRYSMTAGVAEWSVPFGAPGKGYQPLVGDWDGDGKDTIGLYDAATSSFLLRDSLSAGPAQRVIQFGAPGSQAVGGQVGVYVRSK